MSKLATTTPDNADLIKRCKAAAGKPISRQERFQQKVSFVMGMLSHKSTTTREEVIKTVREIEGLGNDPS